MKRKYCLIRSNDDLYPGSFVFVVWVGSSLRESAKLSLVQEFCKDVGWYFKQWSPVVDSVLIQRAKSMRVDGNKTAKPFTMMEISISTCYQTIIDDSWVALESSYVMTPQEKFMRFRNDPKFLLSMNLKKRTTTCSPSTRKYLSRASGKAFYGLTPAIVVIVILIVLDACVTNLINSLFY